RPADPHSEITLLWIKPQRMSRARENASLHICCGSYGARAPKKWVKWHLFNDVPPQRSWFPRSAALRTVWLVVFIADQLAKTG
ncbi:hypothetical protein, partial [Paraburkholderia hospita]|uniref:hypothetical protein n=1 Tax=Paraburkholderia hospita TaxID=169430 RepID=UPI001A98EE72